MKKSKPLLALLILLITTLFILQCGGESAKPASDTKSEAMKGKSEKSPRSSRKDGLGATAGRKGLSEESEDSDGSSYSPSTVRETPRRSTPSSSGLRAGFVDDNKQFNYFVDFLKKFKHQVRSYDLNINERIKISVKDKRGKSLPNCDIDIIDNTGKTVYQAKTYADGTALFFPSEFNTGTYKYKGTATYEGRSKRFSIDRQGKRELNVRFNLTREDMKRVPLDIVFVLDTTGSMGEEIRKLKDTIDIIHLNVSSFASKPDVRFGMVLYKDKGDEYITRVISLTSDLESFKENLDKVEASGGGDGPEDLQSALKETIKNLDWREDGIKLAFIITDATAHLDYGQAYTYVTASQDARKKAIKLFSIGTGGLDINGEYILRQIAQYTYANYIFLDYGKKKGNEEGGTVGAVSHHTGANYQVSTLEALIIRITKKELSHLTNQPVEDDDEYWIAQKKGGMNNKDILKELFDKAVGQLLDYSSLNLEKGTAIAVLPIVPKTGSVKTDAEYLIEQLTMSVSLKPQFRLVDRNQLDKVLKELDLQQSALFDERKTVKLGKLVGAKAIIIGNLYLHRGRNLELFIKLVRVQTAEILSVSKVQISRDLRIW